MRPGSSRPPTFTTPAPGLSCALAPILPHQQQLFLFPAFSVNSPVGEVGGMGQQEEREGLRRPKGAVPLQGQAVPLLAGPLAEIKSAKPQ